MISIHTHGNTFDLIIDSSTPNSEELIANLMVLFDLQFNQYNNKFTYFGLNFLSELSNLIKYLENKGINFTPDAVTNKILGKNISYNKPKTSTKKLKPRFSRPLNKIQEDFVDQAISLGNIANFSVPGSGKTAMALAYFAHLLEQDEIDNILVICPSRRTFYAWDNEYFECFNTTPSTNIILPSNLKWIDDFGNKDLNLITYQSTPYVVNDLCNVLTTNDTLVILDESHNIKRFPNKYIWNETNGGGGLWRQSVHQLAPYAKIKMILSGTPMPRDLDDLYSQFHFLLPTHKIFSNKDLYSEISNRDKIIGTETIKEIIKDYYFRINKTHLQLPNGIFKQHKIPMTKTQEVIYNDLKQNFKNSTQDNNIISQITKNWILALEYCATNPSLLYENNFDNYRMNTNLIPNIQQCSTSELIQNYTSYDNPPKFTFIKNLVNDILKTKNKVIIWSSFLHNIEILSNQYFDNINHVTIPEQSYQNTNINNEDSFTSNDLRNIDSFLNDQEVRLLITTPNSCAESLSFHKICSDSIYLDRRYNAGLYMQSLDRINRFGVSPDTEITYHLLITKNTIDELIDQKLHERFENSLKLLDDPSINFLNYETEEYNRNDLENILQHCMGT